MTDAKDNAIDDKYAFGARLHFSWPGRTTLSAAQWWSGFDDYLSLQKILANHTDTVLETGPGKPANGLGATIAFSYLGGTTREVLVEKDDVNFVWRISMPEPNAMFSFYEGTARIDSVDDAGCSVSYAIDCVLTPADLAGRRAIIDQPAPKGPTTRVDELSRFVLLRDGVRNSFTFPVNSPLEALWAIVGDWGNVSWVEGAVRAEVQPDGRRRVDFAQGPSVEEIPWLIDNADHTLVYEPVNSPMPVRMYHGTLHLEASSPTTTQVTYSQVFVPKDGLDPAVVRAQLAQAFRARFAWIQKRFDASAKK